MYTEMRCLTLKHHINYTMLCDFYELTPPNR